MTDDLRNTMQSAVAREPTPGDAWTRFRGHKRRSTIARTSVAVGVGLAAFAALFFLLPGLAPGTGDAPANLGSSQPAPNPQAIKHYKDAKGHFQLDFPAEWIGRGLAGQWAEFYPSDGGLDEDSVLLELRGGGGSPVRARPKGFYVRVHVQTPGGQTELTTRNDIAVLVSAGASVSRRSIFGEDTKQRRLFDTQIVYPATPRAGRAEPHYWCVGCSTDEIVLPRANSSLEIEIVAPDADTYAKLYTLALNIVESIEPYSAPNPSASPGRL